MRIAIVAPTPEVGGVPRDGYLRRMTEALAACGHDVVVVPPDGWRAVANDTPTDTRVVVDAAALAAIGDADDTRALASAAAAGLLRGSPAQPTGERGGAEPSGDDAEAFFGHVARVIVTGDAAGEWLRARHGVAPEAIRTVVPGTRDAPRAAGSGGPGCAILSVGPLLACAGHDALLAALARLFDLDWHLTLAGDTGGDPAHVAALAVRARELGVTSRLTVAGSVPEAALEAEWARADLFAAVTGSDGYGTPVAEALRRGLPVAIVADASARALVAAEAGVTCAPGDRDTLSKSLRRMIFDTGLRREMAQAAWTVGRALPDWPTQARAFVAALER